MISPSATPEISVVIPCLNEAGTVAACVQRARDALDAGGLAGEVIVADNGSSDGSRELAAAAGARVVPVKERGYGHALMAGIGAARGQFVVMGDADGSYDFGAVPALVEKWRAGAELVQGCRLPGGGGTVEPGAMPWLHQRFGNPVLSWLARRMFATPLHDVYCGLRGFSRAFYERANLRCTGMEFATEMIIKAAQLNVATAEVPITLHRDGRGGGPSHLRTFRDGWRTLRLFLLCSPRWLFLFPGIALVLAGLTGGILALTEIQIGPATLGAHTLLIAGLLVLVGTQLLSLAVFAHTFAVVEGLQPAGKFITVFYRHFNLEKALLASAIAGLAGLFLIGQVWWHWRIHGYGPLDYSRSLRSVIPGMMLVAFAAQTVFGSFMISLLGLDRK